MKGYFYNSSIKNYLNVVSKLFSDIYVMRNTGDKTYLNRVPVHMIDENKVLSIRNKINKQTSSYDIAKVDNIFPKINIKLVDMVPNTLFASGSTVYINKYGEIQHSPAPINMLFEVNITTKSMNDSSMIIEQIIPYMRPHFTVEMKEICGGRVIHERDVRLVYQTTSIDNDALGEHEGESVYDWSIIFEMVGYLYPPQISQADLGNQIKTVFLNFKGEYVELDNEELELETPYESSDIQIEDMSIETEEEWRKDGSKVITSRTENIPIPEKEPSEIRKNE